VLIGEYFFAAGDLIVRMVVQKILQPSTGHPHLSGHFIHCKQSVHHSIIRASAVLVVDPAKQG